LPDGLFDAGFAVSKYGLSGKESSMKKIFLLFLFVFTAGCGGNNIVVKKFEPTHVVHVRELEKLDNISELNNYAGYLDKGDTFPLKLNIDNDAIGISQKSIDIVIKRKLYFMVKMPENPTKEELEKLEKLDFESMSKSEQENFFRRYMLYVGTDAEHWAPMYDGRALKSVLGIKGGRFSIGFGMDKKEGVKSVLTVKTEKQ
jgi:hypothetical protein